MLLYKTLASNSRDSLNTVPCNFDKVKCLPYYIPTSLDTKEFINWQLRLTSKPKKITMYMVDLCNGQTIKTRAITYIIGQDSKDNFYAIYQGFSKLHFDLFYVFFEVKYITGQDERFYSQDFEWEKCENVGIIEACYSESDNGGFDSSGYYLGAVKNAILGNPIVKYFHNYPVRKLLSIYKGNSISYKTLNYVRNVKTTIERNYQIVFEVLPVWYDIEVSKALEKGQISIYGQKYILSGSTAEQVGDPSCNRIFNIVLAKDTKIIGMSCSTDVCTVIECAQMTISPLSVERCFDITDPSNTVLSIVGTRPIEISVISNTTGGVVTFQGSQMDGVYEDVTAIQVSGLINSGKIRFLITDCTGESVVQELEVLNGRCCLGTLYAVDQTPSAPPSPVNPVNPVIPPTPPSPPTPPPVINPSYSITPNTYAVIEPTIISFSIIATGISNGTVLNWNFTTVMINSADISPLSGTVTVNSGIANFTVSVSNDGVTEGNETFKAELFNGVVKVAESAIITIQDPPTPPSPVLDCNLGNLSVTYISG